MFVAVSRWGFPRRVAQIVSQYEEGLLTIQEALAKLAKMYGNTNVKVYYTYDQDGNKISHTCIEFGLPVNVTYVF